MTKAVFVLFYPILLHLYHKIYGKVILMSHLAVFGMKQV